jgi:formylmethanofuran dehydrogenase subunit E
MAHSSRRNSEAELPPAYKMRFYTLTQELHWLGCTFEPVGRKSYTTLVIAHGHACPQCGELFVAEKRRPVHGTLCPRRGRDND